MEGTFFISIKTQVRRLRYLGLLLDNIPSSGIPKEFLFQKVERIAESYQEDLRNYISSSGNILSITSSLTSINNYYNALKALGLVLEQGSLVLKSRIGELYEKPKETNENLFALDSNEKSYFLYIILKRDADYFLCLLDILYNNQDSSLDFLLSNFQGFLIERLTLKIKTTGEFERQKLNEIINRVSSWKKGKKYSEDIVPTRLNWLLDLGLILENPTKTSKYSLNQKGENFRVSLFNKSYSYINSEIINNSYFYLAGNAFFAKRLLNWSQLSASVQEEHIYKNFSIAQERFSIIGIPRLSVEQTLFFICLNSLKDHLVVEFIDILQFIGFERRIKNIKISYRKAERAGESYFSLKYA